MAPVASITSGIGSQALRMSRCLGSDPLWWEVGPPDLRRPWPRRGCPPRLSDGGVPARLWPIPRGQLGAARPARWTLLRQTRAHMLHVGVDPPTSGRVGANSVVTTAGQPEANFRIRCPQNP